MINYLQYKISFIHIRNMWQCLNNWDWKLEHTISMQVAYDANCMVIHAYANWGISQNALFFLHVGQQLLCDSCNHWGGCFSRQTAARWQWLSITNVTDYALHSAHNTMASIYKYVKSQWHFVICLSSNTKPGGIVRWHTGTGIFLVHHSAASTFYIFP